MRRADSLHSAVAFVFILAATFLAACGGKSGGGGGNEVAELLGYKFSEGSKSAPVVLGDVEQEGVVLRQKATVGSGGTGAPADPADSFYVVSGITPGVEYVITLADPTDDATLYVYAGDPSFSVSPISNPTLGTTESFVVQATDSTSSFFISVDGSDTAKGAEFDLSVLVKPLSEGEVGGEEYLGDLTADGYTPINRPGSTVGFSEECCGIQLEGDSYYTFAFGSAQDVLITINDMTDDVDLYVYTTNSFGLGDLICAGTKPGTAVETCLIDATGLPEQYYIAVDGRNAQNGAAYRINVIQAPIGTPACSFYLPWASEENLLLYEYPQTDICYMDAFPSIRSPENSDNYTTVLPGGAPGVRSIDPMSPPEAMLVEQDDWRDSYYWFNGLTPGNTYRLSLEDATDKADLYVFDRDASYSTPVCTPADYPEDSKVQACVFEATSTVVYVAVDGYNTVRGAAFTLQLMPEFVQEGTSFAPLDLGTAPIFASLSEANIRTVLKDADIGILGDKDGYYRVTVLPETSYLVSIPGMSDDVDLYVYGADSTFTTPICIPYMGGVTAEKCTITTEAEQTTLYFAVDGYFTKDGGAFLLSISAGSLGEGTTPTEPAGTEVAGDAPVNLGTAPVNYFGYAIGTGTEEGQVSDTDPEIWNDVEDSFYRVTVNAETTYRITLENVGADVDLFVFDDSGFTNLLDFSRNEGNDVSEIIELTTGLGVETLYIAVDASWVLDGQVTGYQVRVQEVVEPTIEPVVVDEPQTDLEISWGYDYGIGGENDHYYSVSLDPGTYRIQISNLSDDLDLYVFAEDEEFEDYISCANTYLSGTASEYCDVTVSSPVTYYFAVDGAWMADGYTATYDVSVTTTSP